MRVAVEKYDIDYEKTKSFFERRAKRYNAQNPYSVTMYQDDNAELVRQRNNYETEKLTKYLDLEEKSQVLDLACGIGRWADAIADSVEEYLGIDFSEGLIELAVKRNYRTNVSFRTGSVTQLESILEEDKRFNRIIIIGLLMYLNDTDVVNLLEKLDRYCQKETIICIREPIGKVSRLTLKDFYSEELYDNYNAIYRTRDELVQLFNTSLCENGFFIANEGFLFANAGLDNRSETTQYYFIIKRCG